MKKPIYKQIKIKYCLAFGFEFDDIRPGSIHDILEPPNDHKHCERGVWVMGKTEPVKIYNKEFEYVEQK